MRCLRLATAGFALVVLAGCSNPLGMANLSPDTSSLSAADRSFISQAAYGSLAEVDLGKLAQTQASSQQVKEFGGRMVTEHTQMNNDLIALASKKGVTPPSSTDPGREAISDMLEKLSGSEFDRQYIPQQLADHETTLALFQGEANRAQDVDLKQFAQHYTPVVQRHVEMLRRMSTQAISSN
jgi:putative membrane protein